MYVIPWLWFGRFRRDEERLEKRIKILTSLSIHTYIITIDIPTTVMYNPYAAAYPVGPDTLAIKMQR